MGRKILISFFCIGVFLISFPVAAQKWLKEKAKAGRRINERNFIVLKSGERKEIKDIDFPSYYNLKGRAELVNGEKLKFDDGDIIICQDDNAFYKLASYFGVSYGIGRGLASRMDTGAINTYCYLVRYRYHGEVESTFIFFIEIGDDGNLIEMNNNPKDKELDRLESYVSKSDAAKQMVTELRNSSKKVFPTDKLLDIVLQYNKDVVNGKLRE